MKCAGQDYIDYQNIISKISQNCNRVTEITGKSFSVNFNEIKFFYGIVPNLQAIAMSTINNDRYILFNPETLTGINTYSNIDLRKTLRDSEIYDSRGIRDIVKSSDIKYFILCHEVAHHLFYDLHILDQASRRTYEINAD